jgi:hypothetical protein
MLLFARNILQHTSSIPPFFNLLAHFYNYFLTVRLDTNVSSGKEKMRRIMENEKFVTTRQVARRKLWMKPTAVKNDPN